MIRIALSEWIGELESGARPKGGIRDGIGDIPSLGAEHLSEDGGFNFEKIKRIPSDFFNSMNKGHIKKDDILIVKDGATTGKVSFVNYSFPFEEAAINEHVFRLAVDKKKADPGFVFRFLQSPAGQAGILSDFRGATVGGIGRTFVDKVEVPDVPLKEQRRIVMILDKADAMRTKRIKALSHTEDLLKSAFLDTFGDPIANPKGWPIKTLGEVSTKITDGVHAKPKYTKRGVPFVSVKDITTGKLDLSNTKFISEEDHINYRKRCFPQRGDILYTKVGATYGRPALVDTDQEFSLYVSVALIQPDRNVVEPRFLNEIMATPFVKRQADRSIKGIGVPDLHLNMIREFKIPVPEKQKQLEYVNKTQKIHTLQAALRRALRCDEALMGALTQRAFRGEL